MAGETAIYAILTGISTLDAQIRDIDDVAAGDELDALRGRPSPSLNTVQLVRTGV